MSKKISHKNSDLGKSHIFVSTVHKPRPWSSFSFVSVLVLMFIVSGVAGGVIYDAKYNNARATNEQVLGQPMQADDEISIQYTPTTPLPSNDFYTINSLELGGNTASLIWNLNQGDATPTSPFPREGTYRLTYTMDEKNGLWTPVNYDSLGTGVDIRFDPGKEDTLAQWTPVNYDNDSLDQNILPNGAALGQRFYFRLEIRNQDGTWQPVENSQSDIMIPYPEIKFVSQPENSSNRPWTNDPNSESFEITNPIISIFWYGNSDDPTAPYTYLFSSDNPDMSGKQKAIINNLLTHETFDGEYTTANSSYYSLAHERGKSKYYAVYNHAGQKLSQTELISTK